MELGLRECQFKGNIMFDVLPKGSISEEGTILQVDHKLFAYSDEEIPIAAEFLNEKGIPVYAELIVEVRKEGRVIDSIASDKVLIGGNEKQTLSVFFAPKQPGKFTLTTLVSYGNVREKETPGKDSILEVIEKEGTETTPWLPIIILVIISILILSLILKIRKHKKNPPVLLRP